jgi:hypothetical protein
LAKTLTCELKICTYTSATSSAVEWYKSSEVLNIDGNTESNDNGKWQTFIVTMIGKKSFGQKGANTVYDQSEASVGQFVWFYLSVLDRVILTANMRWFPLDSRTTASVDLFFKGFAAAIKTTGTLTLTVPA